jgi:hypothetical protein
MEVESTSDLAFGPEYFELSIADVNKDLENIILLADTVEINGERYAIKAQNSKPKGLTKLWRFRIDRTGEIR